MVLILSRLSKTGTVPDFFFNDLTANLPLVSNETAPRESSDMDSDPLQLSVPKPSSSDSRIAVGTPIGSTHLVPCNTNWEHVDSDGIGKLLFLQLDF